MNEKKYHRPPYILAHIADTSGCGTHRIMRPIETLSRVGVAAGRYDANIWQSDWLSALSPDVVVWQRQHDDNQIEAMKRYRQVLGDRAFIVYEIDDALSEVPESSVHKPFIAPDFNRKMAMAIAQCDAVTVTNRALADHVRAVCAPFLDANAVLDIRIVPNMLAKEDFVTATAVRERISRPHVKPRVGWGGGISHTGDLNIIVPVIEALADQVEWVFLGMIPPGVKANIEFHAGVAPRDYLQKLASLDLDLALAPLEDNLFNRCKSNLRLIEAGACSYPVIASDVETYREGSPPVFGYCSDDPQDWIEHISAFLAQSHDQKKRDGNAMRQWAERNYKMDDKAVDRMAAWLPRGARPFRPKTAKSPVTGVTIICPHPWPELNQFGRVERSFLDAAMSHDDLLYVRPGAVVTQDIIDRMRSKMVGSVVEKVASVSPISNDGGACGFPRPRQFQQIDEEQGLSIDHICQTMMADENIDIGYACGPVVMISRHAIDTCGQPEFGSPGTEEASLIGWSMMAGSRGFKNKVAANAYLVATVPGAPIDLQPIMQRGQVRWPPPKLPPDPLADVRVRIELAFHKDFYRVTLPSRDAGYAGWASLFDTTNKRDFDAMKRMGEQNEFGPEFLVIGLGDRVKIEQQSWQNYMRIDSPLIESGTFPISTTAEWVIFVRNGSTVPQHALFMLAEAIKEDPEADLIYSDHDYLDAEGNRADHDFKTKFDHDLLLQRDYVTPFCAMRISCLEYSDFSDGLVLEADIYKAMLNLVAHSSPDKIVHLPRVLCHLEKRSVAEEMAMTLVKAKIATDHAIGIGWNFSVKPHPMHPRYGMISYAGQVGAEPSVTIIVPTKNKVEMLAPCISTILSMTKYDNYKILIVDNGSDNPVMLEYQEHAKKNERVTIVSWPHPYNWSSLNNWAAAQVDSDFILFLNDDTRVLEGQWLSEMVGAASRYNVGSVGARLIYPHGQIQHVGVAVSNGMSGHIHRGLSIAEAGYNGIAALSHETSAATGACLLVSRNTFVEVGGFNERMAHNFNDVAFGLEMIKRGKRNIICASANLHHLEGVTRVVTSSDEGRVLLHNEGLILRELFPIPDPYWNDNLIFVHSQGGAMVSGLNFDMLKWPAAPWPWRDESWAFERVLVVSDDGLICDEEARDGNVVFRAATDGFKFSIVHPPLENTPSWDIRAPEMAKPFLDQLGISRVVLRTIVGSPAETLSFLTELGYQTVYRPINAEAACPIGSFMDDGKDCEAGWSRGACSDCVKRNNSPFGRISIPGWRDAWASFLSGATLDLQDVDSGKTPVADLFSSAMKGLYG